MSGGFESRWGASPRDDGFVFRIWAPAFEEMRLRLDPGGERVMQACGDGWYELALTDIRAGAAYQFVLPDGTAVPDPASRSQRGDVHGPSIATGAEFDWQARDWIARPLEEAIIYELHPGAFSPEGGFDGVRRGLDRIAQSGVTAIELMPVAQFAGRRGWGYDGVLPYCPHAAYGGVAGLKRLVDAAHERGLMMFLDVVYNHFGPDGNHIGRYAPAFFDPGRTTPWGPAIRFEERAVRDFYCDNALYWLEEFRFDGLRLDAIDQIKDTSTVHILEEMARRVRSHCVDRPIHLMTEDERNIVSLHPRNSGNEPVLFSAEWNDDFHHGAHCLATGEKAGYYAAFAEDPIECLARSLAEGFCYQGEAYGPWQGRVRGEPSAGQPPSAFVAFLQNHDQIGNRAFGERLTALADEEVVELMLAVLLLNPQIPLVFMGEEYGEWQPFYFFTDFDGELARNVREGRRREFADFSQFEGDVTAIPDPNAVETYAASVLRQERADAPAGRRRVALFRRLTELRKAHVVPRLKAMQAISGSWHRLGRRAAHVSWPAGDRRLNLWASFGDGTVELEGPAACACPVHESRAGIFEALRQGSMPGRAVAVAFGERTAP